MSKGLGRIERRILRYFMEENRGASIEHLCEAVYRSAVSADFFRRVFHRYPKVTRKEQMALSRALRGLVAKGYPIGFHRLSMVRGRPMIAWWLENRRVWRRKLKHLA